MTLMNLYLLDLGTTHIGSSINGWKKLLSYVRVTYEVVFIVLFLRFSIIELHKALLWDLLSKARK
jgi:uncharacterized protein (DUF486 family)